MFDLLEQTEKVIEPYRAINSKMSDVDVPKVFLSGYHTAYLQMQF